ncbi:MAG: GAF domain-containing protein, partial [Caldimonas sp.]
PGAPAGRPGRRAGRRSSEPGRQAAICERLVAAAAALGGAQRVLLVLDSSEGPRVAARLLPRRETDAALLRAIAPWLDEARRTGKARLRHGPAGAEPRAQRSCIVAPLRSGRERFGFVYADVEGRRGRFTAADRDRLALLAREAAAALSDVRLTERLALEVEQRDAELAVINRIQQAVGAALDFQAIVDVVGDKLREVFKTDNIGIRWWDEPADRLHYLYLYEHGVRLHVPPVSPTVGTAWEPFFRRRRVAVLNTVAEQDAAGVKALPGTDRALSIVTVPMVAGDRVLGAVNLENHEREHAFGQAEVRLLETIASSMAVALLNARSYEAERQRAAELAIVNGVQAALASKLDVQAIHQLVGDKVRDVFDAQSVLIGLFDHAKGVEVFTYNWEKGVYDDAPPRPLNGLRRYLIATRRTLFDNHVTQEAADRFEAEPIGDTPLPRSAIFVPMVVGDEVKGYVSIQNVDRYEAFTDTDVRLLETLTGSLAVAFESARLFDETQRLLKETEQRNAELAVINSIQQGIAGSLSFQGIVEMVGDKLREVLHIDTIGIRWYDHATRTAHFLYEIERGRRVTMAPVTASEARWKEVTSDRNVIVRNTAEEVAAAGIAPGTECSLSTLTVKIVAGDRVLGVVLVESFEREYAFGEAEIRLLQTIVGEMGVALENARLFDETQRLLKETEQRNAELAVINSIQQSIGGELDFQAIVDVVGDKLREVFATGDMSIRWWDEAAGELHSLYVYEHGLRLPNSVLKPEPGTAPHRFLHEERRPWVFGSSAEQVAAGLPVRSGTDRSRSLVIVPMMAGERLLGAASLENHERDDAFSAADVRLLATVAASMGLALENVRLFNETREALERQTATAEILKVIASSPDEVQPVFDAIAASANRLIGGFSTVVARIFDDVLHLVAYTSTNPEGDAAVKASFPNPLAN